MGGTTTGKEGPSLCGNEGTGGKVDVEDCVEWVLFSLRREKARLTERNMPVIPDSEVERSEESWGWWRE